MFLSPVCFAQMALPEKSLTAFRNVITPVFDDRICLKYRDVLARPKFCFPLEVVEDLLSAVTVIGKPVIAEHTHVRLPDEKDRCFYECALSTTPDSSSLETESISRLTRAVGYEPVLHRSSSDACSAFKKSHVSTIFCHDQATSLHLVRFAISFAFDNKVQLSFYPPAHKATRAYGPAGITTGSQL